jgi:predicted AlkP superfamily pyrophosphatase or phosphodiesterase
VRLTPAVPEPVLPRYGEANLTGVVAALMAPPGRRPRWVPEPAAAAGAVVLLVLDGLGWEQLRDRAGLAPTLSAMVGGAITSVVPSTTATALTSLVVGAPPAGHGVVGYRVAVQGPGGPEVMNVLKWRTPSGDARSFVDPAAFQALAPFGGRPVPVVSKAAFAGTGFTEAHQRGARQVSWHEASGVAVDVRRLVESGEPFVYAYYDGVDRVAHVYGFDAHYEAELAAADRLAADLLAVLDGDTALVVTADHGQVEVGPRLVELDREVMAEVALVSGEPRFRWLHCRQGEAAADGLAERCRALYGDRAWVRTYGQVSAEGWLGGPVTAEVRSRLGDVALAPFAPVAFMEPGEAGESRLVCRHGSLTPAEMYVPFLAARGRLGG